MDQVISLQPHPITMLRRLTDQINTIRRLDPAARSAFEVALLYPGLHAIIFHRCAHFLSAHRVPFLPRLISQLGRFLTGIEIHPDAKIGERLFIDHGSGVVIGETSEVGDDVIIYQAVTLGGTGRETGKRHPTIGNHVTIGAGACVLGNIRIEDHVRIGAGSVVISSIPSHSTVTGIPGRVVRSARSENIMPRREQYPDIVSETLNRIERRLRKVEERLALDWDPLNGAVVTAAAPNMTPKEQVFTAE